MPKKDRQKELGEKVHEPSTADSVTQEVEPAVFYRCACPECGKDRLDVIDSGVFMRSPVLGITSDGEIGCCYTELDGNHNLGIYCNACNYNLCSNYSSTNKCEYEFLSEWGKSNGEVSTTLPFDCPKCDSRELNRVEIGIEYLAPIVAVCESDSSGTRPLVAVSHLRETDRNGAYRYRCSFGHELAKDDGSPVETAQELVEWLKAHRAENKE